MIKDLIAVGLGGFLGSCLRYAVGKLCAFAPLLNFPLGTFLVNVLGCFLIGVIFGIAERTGAMSQSVTLFLVTGFCGGFTTFSTFANDIRTLGTQGEIAAAAVYMLATLAFGISAVYVGRAIAN